MTGGKRRCAALAIGALLGLPAAAHASAAPVEPYQPYILARCLPFVEQAGVREFRDLVVRRVGDASSSSRSRSSTTSARRSS